MSFLLPQFEALETFFIQRTLLRRTASEDCLLRRFHLLLPQLRDRQKSQH
jgi:hypothetical protein